jgi:hypothetical protein
LTYLLLAAFLVTNLGSLMGCVWCDNGCLSSTHLSSHTDDHSDGHLDFHTEGQLDIHVIVTVADHDVSLDQHMRVEKDACIDSYIELGYGVVEDIDSIDHPTPSMLFTSCDTLDIVNNVSVFVNPLHLTTSQRISPSILAHRTIVLLS